MTNEELQAALAMMAKNPSQFAINDKNVVAEAIKTCNPDLDEFALEVLKELGM